MTVFILWRLKIMQTTSQTSELCLTKMRISIFGCDAIIGVSDVWNLSCYRIKNMKNVIIKGF